MAFLVSQFITFRKLFMTRDKSIQQLQENAEWDIVIVGGGATGLGCAVDAASRGFKTLLLEKYDFAKGTSSRATKLAHGGVRYLEQGNIRLVREALLERGRLLKNAPHICHKLALVVPFYTTWQKWYYGFGLWLYEWLSGKWSLGPTKILSKKGALRNLPGLQEEKLKGGILYFDGQFDDSRLAVTLAHTATELGCTVINYLAVTGFVKESGLIRAVKAEDQLNGTQYTINTKTVINATGVFADELLQWAEGHQEQTIAPSQGIHLVVDKKFFPGIAGLMVPKTDDGRVLFAIPWHDKLLLGTTDTPVNDISPEPTALKTEIDFVISHFNRYTSSSIGYSDILSVFAGLRPLAKTGTGKKTAVMPRDHHIQVMPSGLVHVTGGKWTTYRNMAEHAVDKAAQLAGADNTTCRTRHLRLHGYREKMQTGPLDLYGTDADEIKKLLAAVESLKETIHVNYAYTKAEVTWMVRQEMAMTVEDVLARRTRLLFLDAGAAMEAANAVAVLMAAEMGKDKAWIEAQVNAFKKTASGYLHS